jgi:hypothetical protein
MGGIKRKEYMMSDLPDGVDYSSMKAAIAWEMTKRAIYGQARYDNADIDQRLDMLIENYVKAVLAVHRLSESTDS